MTDKYSQSLLEVADLSFGYSKGTAVLKGINFEVRLGERVGLIGPNGAGKTTLFLLVCGVLKKNGGLIRLFGRPVYPGEFQSEVGLVFQNPDDQLFCPSVRDDVAFGPRNLGLPEKEVEARIQEAFQITGIQELGDKPPHHLSGGEKRMVSIAGVLAMRPRLVIYDEPTSNLDIRSRRRLIQFLHAHPGTMLVASHDLEFILEVCDRVILLDRGNIVTEGEPRVVMNNVELMEAHGLERPHSLVPHAVRHPSP